MRQITNEIGIQIKELWEQGVPSREIQARFNLKAAAISQHVRRHGISRPKNISARTNIVVCDDGLICSKCGDTKSPKDFQKNSCGNFLGFCRECRSKGELQRRIENPDTWLSSKLAQYKHRANADGIPFDIDADHIKWLYEKQQARCFYTDYPLHWGHNPQNKWLATSVDKVVPEKGYVRGNVVLAQTRINAAKSDLTLYEMELWMTEWHRRIISCEWVIAV